MTTPKPMPADPHQDPLARVEAVLARSIKELGIFDGLLEAITADGAISPRAPVATLAGGAATVKADLEGLLADLRSGALLISERPAGDRVEAVNGGKLWSLIRSKLPDFAERYSKTDRYEIGSAITDAAARDLAQQIIALLALGPAEGKVTVPREPTIHMLGAGADKLIDYMQGDEDQRSEDALRSIYRAMLDAALALPDEGGEHG